MAVVVTNNPQRKASFHFNWSWKAVSRQLPDLGVFLVMVHDSADRQTSQKKLEQCKWGFGSPCICRQELCRVWLTMLLTFEKGNGFGQLLCEWRSDRAEFCTFRMAFSLWHPAVSPLFWPSFIFRNHPTLFILSVSRNSALVCLPFTPVFSQMQRLLRTSCSSPWTIYTIDLPLESKIMEKNLNCLLKTVGRVSRDVVHYVHRIPLLR